MTVRIPVKKLPLFRFISLEKAQELAGDLKLMTLEPNETLIKFGTNVEGIYMIIEGSLEVYGQNFFPLLAVLEFGDSVGEMSSIEPDQKTCADVRAGASGAKLLLLPRDVLQTKVLADAKVAADFFRGLSTLISDRLRQTNNFVRTKTGEARVVLQKLIDNYKLDSKLKNTKDTIENFGTEIFSSIRNLNELVEELVKTSGQQGTPLAQKIKESSEKVMLSNLQDVDNIAQKLGLIMQYLDNLDRTAKYEEILEVRGDENLFGSAVK